MIENAALILTTLAFIGFSVRRLMRYLHALQQDDYDNKRLLSWVITNRIFDKRITIALIIAFGCSIFIPALASYTLLFLIFGIGAYFEEDARKDSKKALVMTKRAQRILTTGAIYAAIVGIIIGVINPNALLWIAAVQMLPLVLILGNSTLAPYESATQKKFYDDAQTRLAQINPKIIGITGSYGKTSVKHILGHILKNAAPTLITPGSVNTIMGITRIIREQLQPQHQYFVVEMGAYGIGSIDALCKLTPPHYGIISAIGHAHYERFKTLDNVAEAKYELAESVISRGGTMIVHEKTLKFKHARDIRHGAMQQFIACGEPMRTQNPKSEQEFSYLTDDDLNIISIEQTTKGLCVKITWKGEDHTLRAPLYGVHHGHNIALSFACAHRLGMSAKDIKTALASTPQIKHRLEVKQQIDDTIIIDDAYNSNPIGFRSALHVLNVLANDNKEERESRAILVTPGIVELGGAHDDVHHTLGTLAATICDVVVVVNPKRIPTFVDGIKEQKKRILIRQFDHFKDAQQWLIENKQAGDVILLENDLPDIYERRMKI